MVTGWSGIACARSRTTAAVCVIRRGRPGEDEPFRPRRLVFTAHLSPGLHRIIVRAEQDDPDQVPVVWLPLSDAAALYLYLAIGAVLDQPARPDNTSVGPLLLPAMTGASYRWC
ncbi:hypothetical protein QBC98_003272 [Kitasatospora acidiphila]